MYLLTSSCALILNFLSVPRKCGGLFEPATDKIQTFASPNWPGGYNRNIHCEWIIRNRENRDVTKAVVIQFNQFQLQNGSDCKPDNVVLYDGMLHCSDNFIERRN